MGFNTLRDADIAFSGLQTAAEKGELTSAAILEVWENLRGSLSNDILTYLAIEDVFERALFLAYDQEIQIMLGDESYQALHDLRAMQFTHRELSALVSEGLLSESRKNEPASNLGASDATLFSIVTWGDAALATNHRDGPNEDIILAAANRIRRRTSCSQFAGGANVRVRTKNGGLDLADVIVQERMGSLTKKKLRKLQI